MNGTDTEMTNGMSRKGIPLYSFSVKMVVLGNKNFFWQNWVGVPHNYGIVSFMFLVLSALKKRIVNVIQLQNVLGIYNWNALGAKILLIIF